MGPQGPSFPQVTPPGIQGLTTFWCLCSTFPRSGLEETQFQVTPARYDIAKTSNDSNKDSGTVMSALCAPVLGLSYFNSPYAPSFHQWGNWGPERVSNLASVAQAGNARSRIANQVCLTPDPFLFTSQPQHATSTVGRPGWTMVCKQLAPAALQQTQETIQSVEGEGRAILKEKAFFLPSWLRGSTLPQAAKGKEGAEYSLNTHSPNCLSVTLSSHSRENAGPEFEMSKAIQLGL